jgi:hypothetical protein
MQGNSRYMGLLIWMCKMNVGMSSAAWSSVSFDYHVSIALNIRKSGYLKRKKMTSNKNINLKC